MGLVAVAGLEGASLAVGDDTSAVRTTPTRSPEPASAIVGGTTPGSGRGPKAHVMPELYLCDFRAPNSTATPRRSSPEPGLVVRGPVERPGVALPRLRVQISEAPMLAER